MNTQNNNGFPTPENQSQGVNQTTTSAWNETQHTDAQTPSFGAETQQAPEQEMNPFQMHSEQPLWNETQTETTQATTAWTTPVSETPMAEQVDTTSTAWTAPVNQTPSSEMNTSSFEQIKTQTFNQPEQTPQTPNQNPTAQNGWATPQTEHPTFVSQGVQQHTPPMMPQNKSNKKLIILIVAIVMTLILLITGVTYGLGVNNKIQAVETLKKEKSTLQAEKDEADKAADKAETLVALREAEFCYLVETGRGTAFSLNRGSVNRDTGAINIGVVSQETFKSKVQKCKPKDESLKLGGAKERVEQVEKKLQETFDANQQYAKEAQGIADAWKAFYDAAPKGSGTTNLDPATFDRLKGLAAAAMGVDPATIGSTISTSDVATKVVNRIQEAESKQQKAPMTEFRDFIKEQGAEEKTMGALETERDEQRKQSEKKSSEIDEKSSAIKTKESEIWNPFK